MLGDLRDPPPLPPSDRVLAPFRTFMHLTGDDERRRALSAAAGLLADGGQFVFDVFEPSAADIRATHDRWIARREGISERPLWDADERRLELDVRLPGRVVTMTLEWRNAAEWRALCDEAGLDVRRGVRGLRRRAADAIRRATRSTSASARRAQLVERQRSGDRDVQRLRSVGQGDARDRLGARGQVGAAGRCARRPGRRRPAGSGASSASVRSPRASRAITRSAGRLAPA